MKKRLLSAILAMTLFSGVLLTGCTSNDDSETSDIKVGFVYVGTVTDEGYTAAHDKGRLALEEELGVETMYVESVDDTSNAEDAIRLLIDGGCNVIYTTSFGHMDWTLKVAEEFPDVYFGHASGYKTAENMSSYMGRIYEARYLSGVAAGLNTTSNQIGYVGAMPIPEVIRGLNAFALGVKSVNPDASVEVKWTNSWFDPALEKSVTVDLVNSGVDVIAQHCDTTNPLMAASEAGALAVGYNSPAKELAPESYITAPLFNWDAFYLNDVKAIMDGTWETRSYYEGLDAGAVSLDEINADVVTEGTVEAVETAEKAILDGELYVFAGPLMDNEGNLMFAEGESMTDEDILGFNFLVDNVIGSIN